MALGHRSLNRRSVEGRRCNACGRGMAMVNNPNGGRYCRWCGYDPTDEPFEVREAQRVIDELSEQLGVTRCWQDGDGSTCLLPDGHDGPHEFTPDSEITLVFPEEPT